MKEKNTHKICFHKTFLFPLERNKKWDAARGGERPAGGPPAAPAASVPPTGINVPGVSKTTEKQQSPAAKEAAAALLKKEAEKKKAVISNSTEARGPIGNEALEKNIQELKTRLAAIDIEQGQLKKEVAERMKSDEKIVTAWNDQPNANANLRSIAEPKIRANIDQNFKSVESNLDQNGIRGPNPQLLKEAFALIVIDYFNKYLSISGAALLDPTKIEKDLSGWVTSEPLKKVQDLLNEFKSISDSSKKDFPEPKDAMAAFSEFTGAKFFPNSYFDLTLLKAFLILPGQTHQQLLANFKKSIALTTEQKNKTVALTNAVALQEKQPGEKKDPSTTMKEMLGKGKPDTVVEITPNGSLKSVDVKTELAAAEAAKKAAEAVTPTPIPPPTTSQTPEKPFDPKNPLEEVTDTIASLKKDLSPTGLQEMFSNLRKWVTESILGPVMALLAGIKGLQGGEKAPELVINKIKGIKTELGAKMTPELEKDMTNMLTEIFKKNTDLDLKYLDPILKKPEKMAIVIKAKVESKKTWEDFFKSYGNIPAIKEKAKQGPLDAEWIVQTLTAKKTEPASRPEVANSPATPTTNPTTASAPITASSGTPTPTPPLS